MKSPILLAGAVLIGSFAAPMDSAASGSDLLTVQDPVCTPADRMPLEGRASPYDSATVNLGEGQVKICYGRPSARDRTMIGGDAHPFGQPWRAGANEPTTLHTTVPLDVAGVSVAPGSYSIYVIPGEEEWEVVVNASVDRWGIPINDEVRGHDIGSATVSREHPEDHVETLHIHFQDADQDSASMVLEWEDFLIRVPVTVGS